MKWKLTGLRGALFPGSKEDNDGNVGLIRDRYKVLSERVLVQWWRLVALMKATNLLHQAMHTV